MKRFIMLIFILFFFNLSAQSQPVYPLYAKDLLTKTLAKARSSFASDVYLVNVIFTPFVFMGMTTKFEINAGRATAWIYRMYSPSFARDYYLSAMKCVSGDTIIPPPGNAEIPPPLVPGQMELTEPWIESVPAILSAKSGGAEAFIQSHPGATISRALVLENPSDTPVLPKGKYWVLWFASQSDTLLCIVNAVTGESVSCDLTTAISEPASLEDFFLSPNYPNPANSITNYELRITNYGYVSLTLYDLFGRRLDMLSEGERPAGTYHVQYDVSHLAEGMYFYRLYFGGRTLTRAMIVRR